MSTFHPISMVCVVPCLSFIPSTSHAEDMPTTTLEPIIITARGITETSFEAPFSVNTMDSTTLSEQNITTAEQMVRSDSSLDLQDGGNVSYSTLRMRGTGSLAITSLDDTSVDIRVDGVSNGKAGLSRNLIDIDSVEIAKGPQGTIHGSGAEAGSISMTTNDPVDWFEGHVSADVGNKNHKSLEAVLNVPVSNSVALRLAGMTSETENHLLKKEDGQPLNTKEQQGIQAKMLWQNGEHEAMISAYHDKQTNDVPLLQLDFDNNEVATFGLEHQSNSVSQGVSLATKSDFGSMQLATTTAYNNYKGELDRPTIPPEMLPLYYAGLGGVPDEVQASLNPLFAKDANNGDFVEEENTQLSTEIRLASNPDNDIKWITGVYLESKERDWHADGKIALNELPADNPIKLYLTATASNGDTHKSYDRQTQAIFGEITYPATEALDVVAGARYTHGEQSHTVNWVGNTNNPLATNPKSGDKTLNDDALTGRLGLSYAINPNWRLYGLYSRGNKFGGFSDYDTGVAGGNKIAYFKPSSIDAVELGSKFQSTNRRLNMAVALYQNRTQDDHVLSYGVQPTYNTTLGNVDTQSTGAEFSANWQATNHLQIKTDLSYTDTEVTDASKVPAPLNPALPALTKDGNQMPLVPELSGSIGIRYTDDLQGLPLFADTQWYVGADYRYVGERFAEANNLWALDDYGLLGLNMGIVGNHHELSLWGKNLTNEKYRHFGIAQGPFNVGTNGEDRSYGFKYGYFF